MTSESFSTILTRWILICLDITRMNMSISRTKFSLNLVPYIKDKYFLKTIPLNITIQNELRYVFAPLPPNNYTG